MQPLLGLTSQTWLMLALALAVGFVLAWLVLALPARGRSRQLEQQVNTLQTEAKRTGQQLSEAQRTVDSLRQRLAQEEQGLSTERGLSAGLHADVGVRDAQIAELRSELDRYKGDLLEWETALGKLKGKLAGQVRLFEKLAGVLPDDIHLDQLSEKKDAVISATIRHGQRLSLLKEVQDMVQVRGIGRTSEQRLYEAGVGTYWELANQTDQELDEILRPSPAQRSQLDYDAVRADALRLAKETHTEGALWDTHTIDDLETIPGISATFEQRLYAAGISTYEALASTTVEQLANCCRAPATMMPNYADWIAKAKERVGAAAPAHGNLGTSPDGNAAATA